MWLLLTALAFAQDPFAEWQDSRWLVEIETTAPLQIPLSGPDGNPPVIRAVQVESVLNCGKVERAGKKNAFVHCAVDAVALRTSPQADPGRRLEEYGRSLEGLLAIFRSANIEIKVRDDGRVVMIDLADPGRTDPLTLQAARAITVDLMAGFHLQRLEVPEGAAWEEKNSMLMRPPTQPMPLGLTKLAHQPLQHEGKSVLQTTGGGRYTSPYLSWSAGRATDSTGSDAPQGANQQSSGQGTQMGDAQGMGGANLQMQDYRFETSYTGVTVLTAAGGIQERLWAITSVPEQKIIGVQGSPLWYAGHIRRLQADETPSLGDSGLVSAPGVIFPGLPAWEPLQSVGG